VQWPKINTVKPSPAQFWVSGFENLQVIKGQDAVNLSFAFPLPGYTKFWYV